MKKTLAIILAILMIVTSVPFAFAADVASVEDNEGAVPYHGFTFYFSDTKASCKTCNKLRSGCYIISASNARRRINSNNVYILIIDIEYGFEECGHQLKDYVEFTNFQDCKSSYVVENGGIIGKEKGASFKYTRVGSEHQFGEWIVDDTGHIRHCMLCKKSHTSCEWGEWKYDSEKHWKECACGEIDEEAVHTLTEGKCECGYECPHEDTYNNLIRPVQNADGTWGKGKIVKICNTCGNSSLVREVERDHVGYEALEEAAAKLEALLNSDELISGTKTAYTNNLNHIKSAASSMVYTDIETGLANMVADINSYIAAIEAGLADGTMRKADLSYMASLFNEVNDIINGDASRIVPSEVGKYWGPYYYYQNQLNNSNLSQVDYNRNMAEYDFENQLIALIAGLKDGTMLKADYTAIDEAIAELNEKLVDVNLTDEAKAGLEEIKAQLEEMKKDPASSKAALEELEKELEEYETELDAGIADGTVVKVEGSVILEAYDAERGSAMCEKYGEEAVNRIFEILFEKEHEDLVDIFACADSITGTLAENADKIEELKRKIDALYAAIERCIIGAHTCEEYDITTSAKCGENAIESATCTLCGETVTREVENTALTHSFTKYEEVEAPKCGVAGKEVAYCDNGCGETDEKSIEALRHSFTEYVYNEDATCTENGTKTAVCDNGCGETDTVTAEDTMLNHADEDGDGICDDCETEIKDVCPDCGEAIHENKLGEYICMLKTIIKIVVDIIALLKTITSVFA